MTDLELIKKMLEDACIRYSFMPKVTFSDLSYIQIERGYAGFVVSISFDSSGKFKDIGAYE